jgi:hypothetical protein
VPLQSDTTMRAVLAYLDPISGSEQFDRRKQLDNRGMASAAAFSRFGDYVYIATRGPRAIERLDVFSGDVAGNVFDAGLALEGLILSPDDRFLFVDAYMSRELVVYDTRVFDDPRGAAGEAAIPTKEPLTPELLRGKQLFNDSADPRLSQDNYIACAHCHLEGESDLFVWDFTDRGEGLRDTARIKRARRDRRRADPLERQLRRGPGLRERHPQRVRRRGPDERRGLEHGHPQRDPRRPEGGRQRRPRRAGCVCRIAICRAPQPVPHARTASSRRRPRPVAHCSCRPRSAAPTATSGPRLTDSQWIGPGMPLLHDVGTIGPGSGQRLGLPLTGLDTPSLHGLWRSPPYLHDGSAATLLEVLTIKNPDDLHGVTSMLDAGELAELVAYLQCLDGDAD